MDSQIKSREDRSPYRKAGPWGLSRSQQSRFLDDLHAALRTLVRFFLPTSSDAIEQSAAWPKITDVSSRQGSAVLPRARKYEPTTTLAARDWAAKLSTVGKIENHNPTHAGIRAVSAFIGVLGIQCASCISCACSPTMTSNTTPSMTPVRISILR